MRAPIPKPPRKEKKPWKPIRKVSPKQAVKKQAMAQALAVYFLKHGWEYFDDGTWRKGLCQLCGFDLDQQYADFHHRQRASQAGNNTPENGLALHRPCHQFLHANRDVEDAALESPANLVNGLGVKLTDQRRMDLARYLGFGHSY